MPPAPTVPAMATKPNSVMNVMDRPRTKDGMLSGRSTLLMICQVLAPKLCAASTRPPSISARLCSTMRATKGAADTVSGTIAAPTPSEVPTMARVNGIMNTIRMMNGMERMMFTIQPSTLLKMRCGCRPPGSVKTSRTPTGMPMTYANSVESTVMMMASHVP